VAKIEKINLANVNFDLASAKLTSAAKVILNKVVSTIVQHGFNQVTLTGHTDSQATGGYDNKKLSIARAATVDAYLTNALKKYGVSITMAGKAAIDPLASNKDKVGQAVNRRVEITVA
jgi:flagellar motor protein MotB